MWAVQHTYSCQRINCRLQKYSCYLGTCALQRATSEGEDQHEVQNEDHGEDQIEDQNVDAPAAYLAEGAKASVSSMRVPHGSVR